MVSPPASGYGGVPTPCASPRANSWYSSLGTWSKLDTLDVRPFPGIVLKHFTARDVVSRWDVVEAHTRATATTAAGFLDALQARMPFPVRAIQVDGGSEFQAGFEQACQQRDILLFTLPPRSPKLNGAVERAQRTHTEEFYEVVEFSPGGGHSEPGAPSLGTHLQHRPTSPGPGLPYPTTVPSPVAISAKGGRVSLIYWTSTRSCY